MSALDATTRRRLLDFEIALGTATSDEAIEADWGLARLTPSLPLLWDANRISVEKTELSMRELAELADEVLGGAGVSHRTIVVCEEADGRRLFQEAGDVPGWEGELFDYMAWGADSARRPGAEVRETTLAEIVGLRGELMAEWLPEYGGDGAAMARQLLELEARRADAAGDRWFVAPAREPASACCLLSRGEVGQVENVGTLISARGRGLAQAVTLAALAASRAAGHDVTFLSAENDDWPRLMYAKLGFEKVGELHVLRRPPT
jgi:hypothetical protein